MKCIIIVFSFLIRLVVLLIGEKFDQQEGLHYTDIDYNVFSDAAYHMINGESPYKRPTYRYSPLLAFLLIPNSYFGPKFGKLLFIIFDTLVGVLIQLMNPNLTAKETIFTCLLWDFNPFVINISTRGNSDSITCFLLVLVLYLIRKNKLFIGSIFFGIAVHFRIFPAFLALSLIFVLKKKVFVFGTVSFTVFMLLNLFCFYLYGDEFLIETFLYHSSRKDYKHNFAAPWLPTYLGLDPTKSWKIIRILLICFISYFKKDNLELCWAAIITCFIGYNTVCTVQYFDWAFALYALIPKQTMSKQFAICTLIWLTAHVGWLLVAYQLEFGGKDVFYLLWTFSIFVFVGNNALLGSLLSFK